MKPNQDKYIPGLFTWDQCWHEKIPFHKVGKESTEAKHARKKININIAGVHNIRGQKNF